MKVVKYHADGEYYKGQAETLRSAAAFSQKSIYDGNPQPLKNSFSVKQSISTAKNTPHERFDCYLPSNSATTKLINSHLFIDAGKGNSDSLPAPALRNSLYLGRSQWSLNEDHIGKRSTVTNAQANSRDLPEWCLGSMKYYKPEYFDASKMKKGPVDATKRDIFGKKAVEPNINHREQFLPEIGYINSRKDQHRMMLSDKHYDKEWAQKTQSLAPQKLARAKNVNVDLRWPDNGLAKSAITQEKITRKIGKEKFFSMAQANKEKLKKCDVKLYPSSPKNKDPMRESTFKIGGDVRYHVNKFRVK